MKIYAVLVAILMLCVVANAYTITGYVMNITYVNGHNASLADAVIAPIAGVTTVSKTINCSQVIPSAVIGLGSISIILVRDNTTYSPGTTVTYYVCNGTTIVPVYTSYYNGILRATCESNITSTSNYYVGNIANNPYEANIFAYTIPIYVYNVSLYVYPIYCTGSYSAYIIADGSAIASTTSTTSQTLVASSFYASSVDVVVNTTATICFVYIYYNAYYYPPVYNETNITLPYHDFYNIIVSGSGRVETGTLNASINGYTDIVYYYNASIVAVNNTLTAAQPSTNITLVTWCYGSNTTSILVYHAEAVDTENSAASLGGYYAVQVTQPSSIITANISFSASALEKPLSTIATGLLAVMAIASFLLTRIDPRYAMIAAAVTTVVSFTTGNFVIAIVALTAIAYSFYMMH